MQTVTLVGTGQQRGHAHGAELGAHVQQTATALKSHLRSRGHDVDALAARLESSGLCRVAADLTPDLWSEVTATADAAGVPLADVLLLTFLDEVWGLTRSAGCSVIARRGPFGVEVGQTMDLPAWTVGRLLVLRSCPPDSPRALLMSYPGMIGLCGANESGLALAVNALDQFGMDENGLGVALIARALLSRTSIDDAAGFLASVPHAAGQSYTIGAKGRIATFEAGPGRLDLVSDADADACLHTNHPLGMKENARESSLARLRVLQRAVADDVGIEESLSGEVVLDGVRYGDRNSTFAAFASSAGDPGVRFIDGVDLRSGGREWTAVPFRP
jgi:isopenicillin-N N-acyltransferase-like protein